MDRFRHLLTFWRQILCACVVVMATCFLAQRNLCVFVYIRLPATTGGAFVDDRGAFALFDQSLTSLWSGSTRFFCFRHFRIRFLLSDQINRLVLRPDLLIFWSSPILPFYSLEPLSFLIEIDFFDRFLSPLTSINAPSFFLFCLLKVNSSLVFVTCLSPLLPPPLSEDPSRWVYSWRRCFSKWPLFASQFTILVKAPTFCRHRNKVNWPKPFLEIRFVAAADAFSTSSSSITAICKLRVFNHLNTESSPV